MSNTNKYDAEARSAARLGAVQSLYQMETAETPVDQVISQFIDHRFGKEVDGVHLPEGDGIFFADLLGGIVEHQVSVDRNISKVLVTGWKLERLDATVRAILRAGSYEILYRRDVPPKVVISEYVRLSESFFEGDETSFVNGILDKLAHDHRADELAG